MKAGLTSDRVTITMRLSCPGFPHLAPHTPRGHTCPHQRKKKTSVLASLLPQICKLMAKLSPAAAQLSKSLQLLP